MCFVAFLPAVSFASDITDALEIRSVVRDGNKVRLYVFCPSDFTNRLDLFAGAGLLKTDWSLIASDISPNTVVELVPGDSATNKFRYYVIGNADIDTDEDGLSDASEWLIYHTSDLDADSDGDGMADGLEVFGGTDPLRADSGPPGIGFADSAQAFAEGPSDVSVGVQVGLTVPASGLVEADVVVDGGTAAAGDYGISPTHLVFQIGETQKVVNLTVKADIGDHQPEPQEYVRLGLQNITGPVVSCAHEKHVILINDYASDVDSDGLPDWWEQAYFGSLTAALPGNDEEPDGWTNIQEYRRAGRPKVGWDGDSGNGLKLEVISPMQ